MIQHRLLVTFVKIILVIAGFLLAWAFWTASANAANFSINPASGTYHVGSTFDVSIQVDTKGQEINALQMQLSFPTDKLQLVSPSAGSSIIEIYTTPPRFNNSTGEVEIIGGIPNGINVPNGLVSKLTFRVKSVGQASLRFTGQSQILLNDGRGTNVLDDTFGATYKLELPPQQGPIVISDTHPNQDEWYQNDNVNLQWDVGFPPADNYSYSVSTNAADTPDDTPEGTATKTSYNKMPSGINYFHIKAFRDGHWGGVSHYSLKVDNISPAEFTIAVLPSIRTNVTTPIFEYRTTDSLSGIEKYEIKVMPLKVEGRDKAAVGEDLFIEAESPYRSSELAYGSYDVIVRAYDKAGNIRESSRHIEISNALLWFMGENGIVLPFGRSISLEVLIGFLLLLLLLLIVIAYILRKWYKIAHEKVAINHLPEPITEQLTELQKYRARYGKLVAMLLAIIAIGYLPVIIPAAQAQGTPSLETSQPSETPQLAVENDANEFSPPVITSYSANIKDDELFYVSGRTTEPSQEVIVHLQSLVDGNAYDFTTSSDKRGDWTYRHESFLEGGKYILWAHVRAGGQLSGPSPQVEMDVKPIALNWGNSRITYQSLYIGMILALFGIVLALLIYIIVHAILVRRRRLQFAHSLRQAEDAIKRGFIALHRDIEAELILIKQAHLPDGLAGEQKVREQQLQEDLKNIESLVGKEMWEVETFEKLPESS